MSTFHRALSLAVVALILLFALQHDPLRTHGSWDVWLAHPVLAFLLTGGCLVLVAFLPDGFFERARLSKGIQALIAGTVLLVSCRMGYGIHDAFLAMAQFILGPALAAALLARMVRDPRLLGMSCGFLLVGLLLYGIQLSGDDTGRPSTIRWRDAFALMFPKSAPFVLPGGRLRPNLDEYMRSRHLPQGARLQTNSLGFRNTDDLPPRPEKGTLRVLNLGDSFSIGMQIGQQDFLGPLLEEDLKDRLATQGVEVLNAEISDPAYGTYYYKKYGRDYGADIVLLGLCANDMMQADDSFGLSEQGHTFCLDSRGELVPNPNSRPFPGHTQRYADYAYPVSSKRGMTYERPRPARRGVADRLVSMMLRFEAFQLLFPSTAIRDDTPVLMNSFASEKEGRDGRKRYFDGISNLGFFALEELPIMEVLYSKLFTLLRTLNQEVASDGAQLIVVLHPQRFQVHPSDWRIMADVWSLDDSDFDLVLYNENMQFRAEAAGINFCDLLPAFQSASVEGSLYISGGDMHYNSAGHVVAASALAAHIEGLVN